jgi:hypothetical protein
MEKQTNNFVNNDNNHRVELKYTYFFVGNLTFISVYIFFNQILILKRQNN